MLKQYRIQFNFLVVLALLSVLVLPTPAHADELQPPDFAVRILWAPPGIGYIVRGSTDVFPVYQLGGFGCDFVTNSIEVVSYFGFTGAMALEFLNLPAGVTSNTAESLAITAPRRAPSLARTLS